MALKILIVEDYPINREILGEMLSELGHVTTGVGDGTEAVALIRSGQTFDLVFMDREMPTMDGVEATRIIRALPGQSRMVIIGISASSDVNHRECLEAGMNDTLGKPFTEQDLGRIIHKWMPAENSSAPAAPSHDDSPPGNHPRPADDAPRVFDHAKALREFQGDGDLLRQLIGAFVTQLDRQVAVMQAALRNGDLQTVKKEAHSIKGGALNLCAGALADAARRLETACATNAAAAAPLFAEFTEAVTGFEKCARDVPG
jgi:CheY-like chemotaxis protein